MAPRSGRPQARKPSEGPPAPEGFRGGLTRRHSRNPLAVDVEGGVRERLTVLCHVWPSLSPWNVWDLAWRDWVLFAAAADAWVESRKESNRV